MAKATLYAVRVDDEGIIDYEYAHESQALEHYEMEEHAMLLVHYYDSVTHESYDSIALTK